MTLRDTLQQAQITAMEDRDADRVSVLRMLMGAIKNAEIAAGVTSLDDVATLAVVKREVKQVSDSLVEFGKAGRDDLVQKAQYELGVLEAYLPAQLSDIELDTIISEVIAASGATSPKDIGNVMGPVMLRVNGQADGSRVRERVMQKLS